MRTQVWCLGGLVTLLVASAASGQTYNPTKIQFDSPDHAIVSSYVVEYWLATVDPATGAPFSTSTLAKADVTALTGSPGYEALLSKLTPLPAPVVGQTYKATMRARGINPEDISIRSGASNSFMQAPAPVNPRAVSVR